MRSFRFIDQKAGRVIASLGLLLATILPTLTPALAAAATVTSRSIQLSSSIASSTDVSYQINFTAVGAAGAVVVDFCTVTPLIGEACATPAGFSASSVDTSTTSDADVTSVSALDANTIVIETAITAAEAVSLDVDDIDNPSATGPMYARILTYDDATEAATYTSTDPDATHAHVDDGSVAISIRDGIGVSGDVLETMTFCVSGGDNIDAGCTGTLTAPTVKLGTTVGDNTVLDSADTYEGNVYTQISTNAVGGAIVSLRSNTVGCGGLSRAGAASFAAGCGIAAALAGGIVDGEAKFGVKTGTAAGQSPSTGTFRPYDDGGGAYYSNTVFKMNWVSGDAEGVTSTYGDPFLDTNGAPVQNMEMPITFGASASATTPAGRYSAQLSLIATGTF